MSELPELGSVVRWGRVRYEVVGHYCGGSGRTCRNGGRALAVHEVDARGRRLWSGTQCLDAAKVELERPAH